MPGEDTERRPLLSSRDDESRSSRSRRASVNSAHDDYGQRARRESRGSFSSQSSVAAWISEADGAASQAEADTARILARDWEDSEVHVRTALLARAASQARMAAPYRSFVSPHDNKMARVRRRIVTVMESNCTQMIMITLILVEMLAVLFELLLEIGFLSFNDKIDQPLINALHYISVSILSLFVVEFGVYFFALGFKFCCRAWLLLDVIIVTVALITELYMHHRYNAADRTGEPGDDESEVITKEIIFVVTLRIIRIVHSLFTQFQRHEDRITRTVADLEQIITLRFQRRENALIVECDALRADLIDAHSRLGSESLPACGAGAEAVQLAAAEISIEEIRAERDAALQEVTDLRRQVKEQAKELRELQKSSRSNSRSTNAVVSSEPRQSQQPSTL